LHLEEEALGIAWTSGNNTKVSARYISETTSLDGHQMYLPRISKKKISRVMLSTHLPLHGVGFTETNLPS
jgi:hypothetical protein